MRSLQKFGHLLAAIAVLAVAFSLCSFPLSQVFGGKLATSGILRMDWWSDFWNWVGGGLASIGNAIWNGLQDIFSLGLHSAVKNIGQWYRPMIIDLPSISNVYIEDLYLKVRDFSFILLAALIAFAGICYGLESFRLMGEGTAFRILSSSLFSLILIYLIPQLYLILDVGVYSLNSWIFGVSGGSNQITPPAVVKLADTASGVSAVPVLGIAISSVLLCTVAVLAAMRYVVFTMVIVIMPLALILRLFPPTERIGNDVLQAFVGFIVASIMSAIIIQVGGLLLSIGFSFRMSESAIGTMKPESAMAQLMAAGVLLAGAAIPTMLIPTLGGLFTAGGIAGAAAGAAASQIMAQAQLGAYSAVGGALGGVAGAAMGRAAAGELTGGGSGLGRTKLTAGMALQAAGLGAIYAAAGSAGKGWLGGAPAIPAAVEQVQRDIGAKLTNIVSTNTGYLADYLAYNPIAPDHPNAAALGRSFKNEVLKMPPEEAGRMVLNYTGLSRSSALMSEESRKKIGSAFQSKISELDDIRAHRVKLGLERYQAWKAMGKVKECDTLVRSAKEFAKKRAERIERIQPPSPEFEKL